MKKLLLLLLFFTLTACQKQPDMPMQLSAANKQEIENYLNQIDEPIHNGLRYSVFEIMGNNN